MAIYTLVEKDHLFLKEPTEKFDFNNPQILPKQLEEQLVNTMIVNNGIGLTASQVGLPLSVFIMYSDFEKKEIISCFNPKILNFCKEQIFMKEGCLTYPGLWLKIKRPENVLVEFQDSSGKMNVHFFENREARVFQHEIDHTMGINFTELVSKLRLSMAKKRKEKNK